MTRGPRLLHNPVRKQIKVYKKKCVYICIYMYVYVYVYVYICMCIYIYIYICVCVCVCVYVYMYVYKQLSSKNQPKKNKNLLSGFWIRWLYQLTQLTAQKVYELFHFCFFLRIVPLFKMIT